MSVTLTITYAGTSLTDTYAIPFDYYQQDQVLVTTSSGVYTWTFPDAGHIKLSSILPTGVSVTIARKTNTDTLAKVFQSGSGVPKSQLNAAFKQAIFAIQEIATTVGLGASVTYVDARDVITLNTAKSYTDTQIAAAMIAAGAGNVVGPASATDGSYALFNGTTGKLLKVGAAPGAVDWASITGKPSFATVATSGLYSDLSGKPVLATVATSGAYADLSGKPTLGTAAAGTLGTAAGNVVQLDGSAKLPAVDGSQLTGILTTSPLKRVLYTTISASGPFALPVSWPTDQKFVVEAIGSGGGGAASSGGGGGGSSGELEFTASDLSWPLAAVIPAGGVGVSTGAGNPGANATLTDNAGWLMACGNGGNGGTAGSSGGGGGADKGTFTPALLNAGATAWNTPQDDGGIGASGANTAGGAAVRNGGGGGAVSTGANARNGGSSIRGAGGGAGVGTGSLGGTSKRAGKGGDAAQVGSTPGGGGGATASGAPGAIRIWVLTT